MLRHPQTFAAIVALCLHAGCAVAHDFPVTPADIAQVHFVAGDKTAVRQVLSENLPVYTRPVPEAAALDQLRKGALVPLVSEGGGWATMDLGGGFLGWMRSDGLGPAPERPVKAAQPKVVVPPVPMKRRPTAAQVPSEGIAEIAPRKRYF